MATTLYGWTSLQPSFKIPSIPTIALSTFTANSANQTPGDVQQILAVVQQHKEDLCHERACKDALQQEVTTL